MVALLLAACLALSGCTALRVGYANGPQLAWWWLDGYLDFPRPQAGAARQAVDQWFEWHRGTQLPDYAALLQQARADVGEPATAAQACRWNDRARERLGTATQRALLAFADLLPGLTEAQFRHLEQRYLKGNDELRREFLQPDLAERFSESVERTVERAERLYGTLGAAQRKVIVDGITASPFDPEMWLVERQRRQRDTLSTLRRLVAEKADRDQRVAALRALVQRTEQSPDPAYRQYQQRLTDYNCAFAARLHNATTPAQRQKARDRLKGWEEDVRSLMAPSGAPSGAPEAGPPG